MGGGCTAWRTTRPVEDQVDGQRHLSWTGRDGEACVEQYIIAGLPHAVPLAAGGPGHFGRFMLDAGIDSTTIIARSWGLAGTATATKPAPPPRPAAKPTPRKPELAGVITAALRKAGLLAPE